MITSAHRSLSDFFESIYRPHRLLGRARKTRLRYRCIIRQFGRVLGRPAELADLCEERLAEFLEWYSGRVKAATANSARAHFMAMASYAQSQGLLARVPNVPKLPEYKEVPRAWTKDEIALLLGACRGCSGQVAGIPARLYWEAMVRLLYETGIRCGACWQLRRDDVDLERAAILVRPETQKQRAGQWIRFSGGTLSAVRAIWLPERELLFPWLLYPTTRYLHVRRILRRAGLPTKRPAPKPLHGLRASHASYLARSGGDATASLGHSSPAVTRAYLDPRICGGQSAVDLLPPIEPE